MAVPAGTAPTRRPDRLLPEQRLMRAVLEDALRTYFGAEWSPEVARRRVRRETAEWFASDATDWPFSFRNVCRALGLDPARVRADLVRVDRVAA